MTTPLLTTKLYVAPPRPNLVSRPRLIERLNTGLSEGRFTRKLTLVSAPAGFGKTTLLSEWVASLECPVAWLSLDERDNNPAQFWSYVIAALRTVPAFGEGNFAETVLTALQSPPPPGNAPSSLESMLTALINEIAAVPVPFLLVLDDYHLIKAPPVHQTVSFLLDHLPPHLHLAIASRSDPPLPLARLRGRGELVELRAADLRFTPAEAAALLNEVLDLGLAAEDVVALEARTEGWITGLQLASISLRGQSPERVSEFVSAFTGSHRFVLDYLVEEVLGQQPEPVQRFLLQTSILDRLTGPLCDAILEAAGEHAQHLIPDTQSPGQLMLEQLESANLFLIPLDDERRWYRYHRLFADLLRARLSQLGTGLGCSSVDELHRRASDWYWDNGFVSEAINHALAARDLERTAHLVEANGLPMLLRGELTTLLDWLERLPTEAICTRPWLCIYHGWALALSGQLDAAELRLQAAEAACPASPSDDWLGHIAAVRSYIAAGQGEVPRSVELAQQALTLLDSENLVVRSVVAFTLGGTYLLAGDYPAATHAFAQASEMGQAAGNIHLAVPAAAHLADLEVQHGCLHRAFETYRRMLDMAGSSPVAAQAHSGLGGLLYEWNDLEAAERHLKQSVELGGRWGNVDALSGDYVVLAWLYRAQGDAVGTSNALHKAEQLVQERRLHPGTALQVATFRARLAVATGDLAAAERWVREIGLDTDDEISPVHERGHVTLARVLLALDQVDDAARLLARLLEVVERDGRLGRAVEILALQALARQAWGDQDLALASLERALTLAEPEGYIRTFVDQGPQMVELLRQALAQGISSDYAKRLLAAFSAFSLPGPQLPEVLSERELEVLHLVAAGLTNQEIADELIIAVSTVKSHTNSIYGKLGVKNRTQAIAQASTLGLL